ncbi:zinc finger CCCH domain-containing protein 19-like [Dorcoceras hygrometricum]|uniref:Zinc finger CCCH domain-containing protein 19-like n=1 Tax=Dorcoceras hygrometricum TaxID=472368 RepID=A0A2Z7ABY3_9LAMI|nr:zinc finger CCCH domain-containing protein 19-like [Dorcoceras hygrometricum]
MLMSASSHMFRVNNNACASTIVGKLFDKEQQCLRQPLVICSQGTALLTKSYFRHSLHSKSTTMASIFFVNSYQINFESVLMIPDNDGMLNMLKALEANGLRGFIGCESVLYEKELEKFFETALVQGEDITGAVSGKFFSISQAQFAHVFELPTEGLVNFSEVPKDRVYDARSIFSRKGVQVEIHGKKKHMKYEFRLLNDILGKAVTVKAGSFDAVTTEKFQMMTAIHFGLKVNWSKVLFNVLKDMVDKSQRKAKGFAAQIGVLLKGIPAIALGEGVPFPFAKILSMKTVNTYIATNTTIYAREEQGMVSEAIVKRKSKSTKKSSSADDTPVKVISEIAGSKKRVATEDNAPDIPKKRRTVKTKPSPSQESMVIVNVAQDVVPIQVIDPTPVVATIKSPAPKLKSRKRRLVLPTGSDDETMGTQELAKDTDEAAVKPTDEVDITIEQELAKDTDEAAVKPTDEVDITIEQVLEETLKLGVNEEEHGGQGVDEAMFADDFSQWLDDFVSRNSEPEIVGIRTITEAAGSNSPVVVKDMNRAVSSIFTNKEHMSIDDLLLQISDDMLLPSITATEITKIRLGESISITKVRQCDIYPASLPRISIHDKGKAIFFNKLTNFDALLALKEKEKLMLEWAETDSLAMAVKRKEYILAKYRELLLRTFLDSHRKYFAPGQPWTETASQIIDLLSDAHSISLEDLLAHQREHGLSMEQPCASTVFDSSIDSGAVLARFYSAAKSTCWVRPMILIDGVCTPLQGPDFWKSSFRLSLFLNQKKIPEPVIDNIFVPHVLFIEPIQYWEAAPCLIRAWKWTKVCTEIIQFSMFGCLPPVREDVCQEIVVYNLGVERIPAGFLSMFAQGMACHSFVDSVVQRDSGNIQEVNIKDVEEVDLVSSDGSTVYRSPSPIFQEVDSVEHDLQFALGPVIFPSVAQEERLYYVQSPESSPAISLHQESSSSSTDVSMYFDFADIPRIHDSNCEILSKITSIEFSVREALLKQNDLIRQSLQNARRDHETQGFTQVMHINDLKKEAVMPKRGKEVAADLPTNFLEVAADLFNHLLQIKFEIVDMWKIWKSWKRMRKEFMRQIDVRQIDMKEKETDREERGGLAEVERLRGEEDFD